VNGLHAKPAMRGIGRLAEVHAGVCFACMFMMRCIRRIGVQMEHWMGCMQAHYDEQGMGVQEGDCSLWEAVYYACVGDATKGLSQHASRHVGGGLS
jgi:hypothetical protein